MSLTDDQIRKLIVEDGAPQRMEHDWGCHLTVWGVFDDHIALLLSDWSLERALKTYWHSTAVTQPDEIVVYNYDSGELHRK